MDIDNSKIVIDQEEYRKLYYDRIKCYKNCIDIQFPNPKTLKDKYSSDQSESAKLEEVYNDIFDKLGLYDSTTMLFLGDNNINYLPTNICKFTNLDILIISNENKNFELGSLNRILDKITVIQVNFKEELEYELLKNIKNYPNIKHIQISGVINSNYLNDLLNITTLDCIEFFVKNGKDFKKVLSGKNAFEDLNGFEFYFHKNRLIILRKYEKEEEMFEYLDYLKIYSINERNTTEYLNSMKMNLENDKLEIRGNKIVFDSNPYMIFDKKECREDYYNGLFDYLNLYDKIQTLIIHDDELSKIPECFVKFKQLKTIYLDSEKMKDADGCNLPESIQYIRFSENSVSLALFEKTTKMKCITKLNEEHSSSYFNLFKYQMYDFSFLTDDSYNKMNYVFSKNKFNVEEILKKLVDDKNQI
jgi:hypothetical protein